MKQRQLICEGCRRLAEVAAENERLLAIISDMPVVIIDPDAAGIRGEAVLIEYAKRLKEFAPRAKAALGQPWPSSAT